MPKQTKFFAATPIDDIKGESIQQRVSKVSHYFMPKEGFMGARHDAYRKCITIFFADERLLDQHTDHQIVDLDNAIFLAKNSQAQRAAESKRTVKVTDIPLNVKSEDVKQFFTKYGIIERFSMVSRGAFQTAYVVYNQSADLSALYDDTWSVDMLDFSVRLYPLDLSAKQLALRHEFVLKLAVLPPKHSIF